MKNKYSIFSLVKNAFSYHENWQRAWKDPSPKKEYDAVIVGGGGHGLATAYYLAKKHNMKNMTILFLLIEFIYQLNIWIWWNLILVIVNLIIKVLLMLPEMGCL